MNRGDARPFGENGHLIPVRNGELHEAPGSDVDIDAHRPLDGRAQDDDERERNQRRDDREEAEIADPSHRNSLLWRRPDCRISNDSRAGSTDRSGPASPTDANIPDGGMDRDLVEAAQRGDQEAFVDLVQLHGDRLYAIAHRILRDVDRAEDALQDALVIAWRDLPSLRDPDRFDAWLHRVLTNVCISQATRERGRIATPAGAAGRWPGAPTICSASADRDELDRAFRHLRRTNGRSSCCTISWAIPRRRSPRLLGVPGGTVRSRLHHAHRAMRAALDAEARDVAGGSLMNERSEIERALTTGSKTGRRGCPTGW